MLQHILLSIVCLLLSGGRFGALAPVVHLVLHFDVGCPCESRRSVMLAAGGRTLDRRDR